MLEAFRLKLAALLSPELLDQRDQAQRLANTDSLTTLANRRAFDLALPMAEMDHTQAIIVFDLNNFKRINDHAGHQAGDLLLVEFARVMSFFASRSFRIGGDEFAAIVPARQAQAIRDAIEQTFTHEVVSASGTIGNTYHEADQQLQTRKNAHKEQR
jgi:diguanylate cyclase (GGDEF)-like protein